jgi:hypothetical protein
MSCSAGARVVSCGLCLSSALSHIHRPTSHACTSQHTDTTHDSDPLYNTISVLLGYICVCGGVSYRLVCAVGVPFLKERG